MQGRNIVVIGTSAGGLEALGILVPQLPTDIPASIFIVQHMGAENNGAALLRYLSRNKAFQCKLAENGETFEPGRIYLAPPDSHLLVKEKVVLVTKGARENRYRPAIDPLFRSAAVAHGVDVIGIVLTGMLDDGTAGLIAIKRCGGVTIVQDPKDAAYPEMPESALRSLDVDYCVPISAMGPLIEKLSRAPRRKRHPVPKDVLIEATIAERIVGDAKQLNGLGDQVPCTCPDCGGPLWEMKDGTVLRFRCHTGHSFTASFLMAGQTEKIEETLWTCLRMFEERKNLLHNMERQQSLASLKTSYRQRAEETQVHIDRIRGILQTTDTALEAEAPKLPAATTRKKKSAGGA